MSNQAQNQFETLQDKNNQSIIQEMKKRQDKTNYLKRQKELREDRRK